MDMDAMRNGTCLGGSTANGQWTAAYCLLLTAYRNEWCGRGDSNPHGLATVSPSSWCVCQFRHFRTR